MITQILIAGAGLSATLFLPDAQSMLVAAACAAIVPWFIREPAAPAARETAAAVARSRTMIGGLEAPRHSAR